MIQQREPSYDLADDWSLRLLPFEEYFLCDESAEYPMVFPYGFRFRGVINRAAFEQAIADVLPSEPLLRAQVVREAGRNYWRPCAKLPEVEWHDASADDPQDLTAVCFRTLDLSKGPGLHVVVEIAGEIVTVIGHFHHSCADGLAANRFLANVFARYGQLLGDGQELETTLPEPSLLAERGDLGIELPEPISTWEMAKGTAVEIYKWLARRPTRLATDPSEASDLPPALLWRRIEPEFLGALREAARQQEATVNDVLISEALRVAERWNRTDSQAKNGWVRVMAPTNLRRPQHRRTPTCNILGYAFISRRGSDCGDRQSLLRSVTEEMQQIRYWSLGSMFLHGLCLFRQIPFAMSMSTRPSLCHATTVVSNIGHFHGLVSQRRFRKMRTIAVGDLELEDIFCAPPVRPNTPLNLCVVRHLEQMNLCVAVDRRVVSLKTAERFLDSYLESLQSFVGSPPELAPASVC